MLSTGTRVAGRYEIVKVLGQGGMGFVYEATDLETGARVAVKALREDLYEREDLVQRFEREARAAGRIGHANIVGVLAVGADESLRARFIVQECLRGTDVSGCLNDLGSLSPHSTLAVALPVMDALIAAHAAGIVHRDIKPENVFLHEADDGTIVPKVIDFGIAKVTEELDRMERTATGMVFGTPWYMSPEQALGDSSIDARTDVWSVGAMIYEMLCGTLPFGGTNPNAVMAQIIYGSPAPLRRHWPEVPADLEAVVHRAIERDLSLRYATLAEFRAALAGCALWRDVTPEIAQAYMPRASSFDDIDDLLPADFRAESGDAVGSVEPATAAPSEPASELAPSPRPETRAPINEDRLSTRPRLRSVRRAPARDLPTSLIGTELPLLDEGPRAPQASFRRAPPSWRLRRMGDLPAARWVTRASVAMMLFCGGIALLGALHWVGRPPSNALTASLAAAGPVATAAP